MLPFVVKPCTLPLQPPALSCGIIVNYYAGTVMRTCGMEKCKLANGEISEKPATCRNITNYNITICCCYGHGCNQQIDGLSLDPLPGLPLSLKECLPTGILGPWTEWNAENCRNSNSTTLNGRQKSRLQIRERICLAQPQGCLLGTQIPKCSSTGIDREYRQCVDE